MSEFDNIEKVAKKINNILNTKNKKYKSKKKLLILYAFNATGKTRLSSALCDLAENEVLCYNAFVEDMFTWNNENYIIKFNPNSWIANIIDEQGLDKKISDNFSKFIDSKIEPSFDMEKGEIKFNIASGDENTQNNIKISKGEESMFIWSIFYTILEIALEELNLDINDRSTKKFNNYHYIIIDDPVSSIDDTKLISMALSLIDMINHSENTSVKFLITTHHALFYNIFFNNIQSNNKYYRKAYILSRNENIFKLTEQNSSPFGYHLAVKYEIENAINTENIKRYHFNMLRALLEKTANFLGYNKWNECITGSYKNKVEKLLNLYSHDSLSDLDRKDLLEEEKTMFIEIFNKFISKCNYKI